MNQKLQPVLELAQGLSLEDVPRLLGDLEEIRATAMARLMTPAPAAQPDELIEVDEASHRLGVSADYLYHTHSRLPFTRRQGRKLLFSAQGIEQYIRRRPVK